MVVFTPNIPQPGDFPSESQPLLLANAQYLAGTASKGLLRDHDMTLNTANAADGTHKQVTMQANLGGTPGFTGGVSALYPKLGNGQSQVWFDNGTVDTQLTTTKANVPSYSAGPPSRGVSYLPGGILIQYGFTQDAMNITTFQVAFSATPYSITVTYSGTTSAPPLGIINPNTATFAAAIPAGTGNIPYYWVAIGPA